MLSKCANPACSAPFLYLHEGKIFNVEVECQSATGAHAHRVERYWLCDNCARTMTICWQRGVVVTRLLPSDTEFAAAMA